MTGKEGPGGPWGGGKLFPEAAGLGDYGGQEQIPEKDIVMLGDGSPG